MRTVTLRARSVIATEVETRAGEPNRGDARGGGVRVASHPLHRPVRMPGAVDAPVAAYGRRRTKPEAVTTGVVDDQYAAASGCRRRSTPGDRSRGRLQGRGPRAGRLRPQGDPARRARDAGSHGGPRRGRGQPAPAPRAGHRVAAQDGPD